MEIIKGRKTLTVLYEPGEEPEVPDGYEEEERLEPKFFRGLLNPGFILCRLKKDEM